jgi:hypothetical protein
MKKFKKDCLQLFPKKTSSDWQPQVTFLAAREKLCIYKEAKNISKKEKIKLE